jgi:hypothetical protein
MHWESYNNSSLKDICGNTSFTFFY